MNVFCAIFHLRTLPLKAGLLCSLSNIPSQISPCPMSFLFATFEPRHTNFTKLDMKTNV